MAGFEGVKWASNQMQYLLEGKKYSLLESKAKAHAVSRSIHYGLFLVFEGIRFFCQKNPGGELEAVFLNWDLNLQRFRRGISFNLGPDQQHLVPEIEDLIDLFIHKYFHEPAMYKFLEEMAEVGAQGYLRPFTIDEDQSIGVTFPANPSIRAVVCSYDRYLGEPFTGVVIPHMVRAVGVNGTGCLKLGVNYLISVKSIAAARQIYPQAASALFLDDNPYGNLYERKVTEWDSSCCLFALREGTIVKIPESNLILPSVTIRGITAILSGMGVTVEERDMTYGELVEKAKAKELVAICSIGTAGILNRCSKLILIDEKKKTIAVHEADEKHDLYRILGEARKYYWDIYRGKADVPESLNLDIQVIK